MGVMETVNTGLKVTKIQYRYTVQRYRVDKLYNRDSAQLVRDLRFHLADAFIRNDSQFILFFVQLSN